MEKEIIKIQIALFFKNDYLGSFEEFSLKIKEKIGNSINGKMGSGAFLFEESLTTVVNKKSKK